MSGSSFLQSIKKASDLALKAKVRSHYNPWPNLPSDYISQVRNLPYYEQWEMHNKNFWYHIKLNDQSLLYFENDSFKFIPSPFDALDSLKDYEDRVKQELFDNGYSEDEIQDYLEDVEDQYQNYLDTESALGDYTPLRVDTHPNQYNKVNHPLSHLHIGHGNESRVPIKRIMTPLAFTGFVISTFYPSEWEVLRVYENMAPDEFRALNEGLPLIPHSQRDYWCNVEEEMRFYLV